MFYFIFCMFSAFSIFADDSFTSVTENDPSTIVDGVSVITGDFYTLDEDYTVQGAEPIHFQRAYISRGIFLGGYEHLMAAFFMHANQLSITEPNGTPILYYADPDNKIRPAIGKDFYGKNKDRPLRYNAHNFAEKSLGVSNTSSGRISGQTHLKNQYLIFNPHIDTQGRSFTLYAANGTKRRYTNFENQQKTEIPFTGIFIKEKRYLLYCYRLASEELPNGHQIHYDWDHQNRLYSIRSTNRTGSKTFVHINLPLLDPKNPSSQFSVTGSDGQSFSYQTQSSDLKNFNVPSKISPPEQPDVSFGWVGKKKWVNQEKKNFPHMSSYSLPNKRTLQIEYGETDKWGNYRVKTLSSPVGKNATPLVTHTFSFGDKNSHIIDIKGNKTRYEWNDQDRITRIERFSGSEKLHSEDRFSWDGTLLKSKSLYDAERKVVRSRSFEYDGNGNVKKEIFSGNLSGLGSGESCTKIMSYTSDQRNLPVRIEEASGLVTKYTYVPDTNLVKTKELCDGDKVKITHSYDYDADLLLTYEVVDDGVCKIVKRITPKQAQPFIGMPEIVEEKYIDGSKEILLRKTVLHYQEGALVKQRDIYDGDGSFQYSLKYEYDGKKRLKSETNAIGQEAVFKYDDVGNLTYHKDFSGRLETTNAYDFSNRLIEKKVVGDGVDQVHEYSYDAKHNLEYEIDPRGNKTIYEHNLLGKRIKTTLPPIPSPNGEMISPVIRQEYDAAGNETLRIDADGHETKTTYNAYDKPILVIHPDQATDTYIYNLNGTLKTHTDARGVCTSYVYDYLNRVVEKTVSSGSKILTEETFEYTGHHLMVHTDAEKNRTTYTYDLAGRKASETVGGETVLYFYDSMGRQNKTQKSELLTITEYDPLDRVTEERNESPSGEVFRKVQHDYDDTGSRKTITRFVAGEQATEINLYDPLNRLIEKTNAQGFVETIAYKDVINAYGQKVLEKTHTDAMGLQTIETYDTHNRVARIEKRKENTLSICEKFYSARGPPCFQIDKVFSPDNTSRQIRTCWEYNSRGRLETLTEAEGTLNAKITRYTYTPRGELECLHKPDGVVVTYTYSGLGQLESIGSSDNTVQHQMTYNLLGHLQTSDALTRTTDPKGRLLSETFPQGYAISSRYDSTGRRSSCEIPAANCLIEYGYNATDLKEVSRKTLDGNALYSHNYLSHDLSGNLLKARVINGGDIQYTVDTLSRKTAIATPAFAQEILKFDPVGNIRQMTIQQQPVTYDYDDLYQLTSESGSFAHNYLYDTLYNRLKKDAEAYEINALNQVTSHLEYNLNGNPIRQDDTIYTYDALDRLIKIETSTLTQTFQYDSLHRCLSKTTNQQTQYFLYDSQKEIGSLDENLAIQELRILGHTPHAEIGAAIAIELQGKAFAPIHDLQGNIAALVPVEGDSPTQYRYSAFGEEQIDGPTLSPWRFSSKRSNASTNLVYYGRRFYMPLLGRWLTPDPAGFTDGMNLYAFVHNDPLTHFDEYGLFGYGQTKSNSWNGIASRSYQTAKDTVSNTWNDPRFQGSMQAFGGLAEATIGGTMALGTGGIAAPLGWLVMAHGIDQFVTGMNTAFSRRYQYSTTNQVLQKTGLSPQTAGLIDGGLSLAGGIGGTAAARFNQILGFPRFCLPEKSTTLLDQILFGQKSIGKSFSHGKFQGMTLNKVVDELRKGNISADQLPIKYIMKDGQIVTFNNRSLLCLRRAKLEPTILENVTGDQFFEEKLIEHLKGSDPSSTIRIRGGPSGSSSIGP